MQLEYKCHWCDGEGVVYIPPEDRPLGEDDPEDFRVCAECEGTGFLVTKKGVELLVFLRRHSRLIDNG